jgi:hypothetical protein
MNSRLQTLLHLAGVIDSKREKMEAALTDARMEQLSGQIELLTKQFQAEYEAFMASTPSAEGAAKAGGLEKCWRGYRVEE